MLYATPENIIKSLQQKIEILESGMEKMRLHCNEVEFKYKVSQLVLKEAIEANHDACEKLKIADDALVFYSDSDDDEHIVLDWDRVNDKACLQDRGKEARKALKQIRGEG